MKVSGLAITPLILQQADIESQKLKLFFFAKSVKVELIIFNPFKIDES